MEKYDDGYDAGYKDGYDAGINNSVPSQNEELSLSFETVSDLLNAIKNDPYTYANKTIQVKGTLAKCDPILALVEINEPLDSYYGVELRYQIKNNPSIDIKITDDILYTVAEHNDYLQISGVVKIVNGEIYLDNCTY